MVTIMNGLKHLQQINTHDSFPTPGNRYYYWDTHTRTRPVPGGVAVSEYTETEDFPIRLRRLETQV